MRVSWFYAIRIGEGAWRKGPVVSKWEADDLEKELFELVKEQIEAKQSAA